MIMPIQTQQAIDWALAQPNVSLDNPASIVDAVREYFNDNDIPYATFAYDDIIPYLPLSE